MVGRKRELREGWGAKALRVALSAGLMAAGVTRPAAADPDYKILHYFSGVDGGNHPNAVVGYQSDPNDPASWALYGTTAFGGGVRSGKTCHSPLGCGIVFKLAPPVDGSTKWTETRLFVFNSRNGNYPTWIGGDQGLLIDKTGALYGTTGCGGLPASPCDTKGTLFRLSKPGSGQGYFWNRTGIVLPIFAGDGYASLADVVMDGNGALYTSTFYGGASGGGAIIKVTPSAGAWSEEVIFSFSGGSIEPMGHIVMGASGTLFGSTFGTVYSLTPPGPGQATWTFTRLHEFDISGSDGWIGQGGVVGDASGALYGTTRYGGGVGSDYYGIVYKLTPPMAPATAWTYSILHRFDGQSGNDPTAPLYLAPSGALYGTASGGGYTKRTCPTLAGGCGVVFKLAPPAAGATEWTYSVVHAFEGPPYDGAAPMSGLNAGPDGTLYGTTTAGGYSDAGIAFSIIP